ncbi:3-keto-disaccharide hydrolase [Thalassoroseus pseudoceratinae]|uniref:3-keto-disaccharide hydrolase n=1 Tax=Thalassoroseus pseudoceratinae TaxID=2713176 RepID=UPI001424848D|nr:DUF1080 domain-containing protein [Thalassoroseus pseudoceratinae]
MKCWSRIACVLALLPHLQVLAADDYKIPYLGGNGLTAWSVCENCEVEFVDGELLMKSGDGWMRSHHRYRDFQLHFEWKAPKKGNWQLGVYLRAHKPGVPFLKATSKNASAQKIEGAFKKGQWNTYDITVRGNTVTVRTNNGEPTTSTALDNEDGYIGLEAIVPDGSHIRLRNIEVTETGFRSLLDGSELTHWEGAGQPPETCWELADGVLTCVKPKGPWLRSRKEYGDFNLRLQYRLQAGSNSGVYVRVPHDGNHHRDKDSQPPAGFEVQVLDDSAEKYKSLKDYQYSASVYDIAGASPRVCRPPGQWNTLEIECKGHTVRTVHNGVEVVHVTAQKHPLIKLRQTRGYLGLQNHGVGVSFRNLRIRED